MNSIIGFIQLLLALTINDPGNMDSDKIEGKWLTAKKNVVVNIYADDGKFYGKVVDVFSGENEDDKFSKKDIGKIILIDIEKEDDVYEGEFYVPFKDKTLDCEISFLDENTIELSVSVFMFSKDFKWTRYMENEENSSNSEKENIK